MPQTTRFTAPPEHPLIPTTGRDFLPPSRYLLGGRCASPPPRPSFRPRKYTRPETPMTKQTHDSSAFPLFSEEEHGVLDARSFAKPVRGRPATHVVCAIRNKAVLLKPEERTRQLWLSRLLGHYGYPASRIAVEYPITFGRDSSKRADIVVFDADRTTVPYIIIEVKQPSLRDGKEQLRSYAHATGAPLALWSNGILAEVWHRKNPNYFVPIHDLPRANQTIENIVDQPWTIHNLIAKEQEREREGARARSLRDLIVEMEN